MAHTNSDGHTCSRMSATSRLHYLKLSFRAALFLVVLIMYILEPAQDRTTSATSGGPLRVTLLVVWAIFLIEMIVRFFPSRRESAGSQKQYASAYRPTGKQCDPAKTKATKSVLLVVAWWIALNAAIGVLYFMHVISEVVLFLICLAYSVCDEICILFFCPFQKWIMKNRCCITCRIYNWDYAMMCTPLVFIPDFFTWTLLFVAVGLLVRWELTCHRYPERFSDISNAALQCVGCQDKLCATKKKLRAASNKRRT